MKVRTLLVDDDQSCKDVLKEALESFPFIQVIKEANSANEALDYLIDNSVDLVILDIEMEGMDGLQLAHKIEALYPKMLIIFVTGHPGFALEGYEVHPVDFLTKPVNIFRLGKALQKVRELRGEEREKKDFEIGVNVAGGIRMIRFNSILLIEKKGRKTIIVCDNNEKFETRDTMKKLEEIFDSFDFYRPHQSFLVPVHRIKSIQPDSFSRTYTILLNDNETKIPLSRNNYNELKELLQQKIKGFILN